MTSTLPSDTIIQFRSNGQLEFWQLVAHAGTEQAITGVDWSKVKPGTVVHKCVCKNRGNTVESRGTFTLTADQIAQQHAEQKAAQRAFDRMARGAAEFRKRYDAIPDSLFDAAFGPQRSDDAFVKLLDHIVKAAQ